MATRFGDCSDRRIAIVEIDLHRAEHDQGVVEHRRRLDRADPIEAPGEAGGRRFARVTGTIPPLADRDVDLALERGTFAIGKARLAAAPLDLDLRGTDVVAEHFDGQGDRSRDTRGDVGDVGGHRHPSARPLRQAGGHQRGGAVTQGGHHLDAVEGHGGVDERRGRFQPERHRRARLNRQPCGVPSASAVCAAAGAVTPDRSSGTSRTAHLGACTRHEDHDEP